MESRHVGSEIFSRVTLLQKVHHRRFQTSFTDGFGPSAAKVSGDVNGRYQRLGTSGDNSD
jgi:hypothetical protein